MTNPQLPKTVAPPKVLDFVLKYISYFLPCNVTNQKHFTETIKEGWRYSKTLQVTEIFMWGDDWHSKDSPHSINCCFFKRRKTNLLISVRISQLLPIFLFFFFLSPQPHTYITRTRPAHRGTLSHLSPLNAGRVTSFISSARVSSGCTRGREAQEQSVWMSCWWGFFNSLCWPRVCSTKLHSLWPVKGFEVCN